MCLFFFFFFQAEDGIRDIGVTGVQTCALPIYSQAVEELVVDGVNGWTFYPDRPTEVRAALDRALQASPRALEALRKAATSRALDLSPERIADSYLKAISFAMSSAPDT